MELIITDSRAEEWFIERLARGCDRVFTEVVELTPSLAKLLLSYNANNRTIRKPKLTAYISDLNEGRWSLNGESLIISTCGYLNDGQHRCLAVMKTGKSMKTLITFGIERATRDTVNQGVARGLADYLTMGGMKNATATGAAAKIIMAYERSGGEHLNFTEVITSAEAKIFIAGNARLEQSICLAISWRKTMDSRVAASIMAFCHYTFSKIDTNDADKFMHQLAWGENIGPAYPAFVCRERLLSMGRSSRGQKTEIIFRAWNAYRRGQSPRNFQRLGQLPELV
jgi:hypothetical protein